MNGENLCVFILIVHEHFNCAGTVDFNFMDASKVRAHVVQLLAILEIRSAALHDHIHWPIHRPHVKLFR